MSDLLERLRHHECYGENNSWLQDLCGEAADEIERLERQAEQLRDNIGALIGEKAELSEALQSAHEPPAEQPVAWIIPGDDTARADGSIDARISEEGEFTKPLYARPYYLGGLSIEQWREHAKAGWAMYAARTSQPPSAAHQAAEFKVGDAVNYMGVPTEIVGVNILYTLAGGTKAAPQMLSKRPTATKESAQ